MMVAFEIDVRVVQISSLFREEGLSNPGVPEHRGLITPPLERDCYQL
jgi:hypothetical protein